jgi:hypothetical protein
MTETLVGVSPPPSKDPADPPSAEELAAAKELVRQARAQGVALTGPGGLLKALTKTVLETALEEEMAEHLGYDRHDPLGRNRGNSRNGKRAKTVLTDSGEVAVEVPRDRDGSFEPVIVAKRQRRLSSIDEIVLSLYARGLTTGDIAAHFAEIYDAQVSKDTISRITDRVVEEMQVWTSRPLEPGRFLANVANHCGVRCRVHRCMACCGVWSPRQRRGRSFSSAAMLASWSAVQALRSVPFGKYCRSRPLMFSFAPRCQGECGSAK